MKNLLLMTTTLLLLNVSVMADGTIGPSATDCSDMSDIVGADTTAVIDPSAGADGSDAAN